MKLALPASQLALMFGSTPVALIRFIGVAEIAAVVGLLLPSLTRILPVFTPLAAIGLATVMVCAVFFHISRSEWTSLPGVVVLGALAAFTAWDRYVSNRNPTCPANRLLRHVTWLFRSGAPTLARLDHDVRSDDGIPLTDSHVRGRLALRKITLQAADAAAAAAIHVERHG